MACTGGTITTVGAYTVHTFTSSGDFVCDSPISFEYLIVAGGGSGGYNSNAGGGGGGGVLVGTSSFSVGSFAVVVGDGGGAKTSTGYGNNGQNSSVNGLTAIGGGGGAGGNSGSTAQVGGSGGGGAGYSGVTTGAVGTSGQGSSGGVGYNSAPYPSGGGGGAGGAGVDGVSGGHGGIGITSSISGVSNYYGGGGGGGTNAATKPAGGLGGGGAGGAMSGGAAVAGTANTGGGGGGGASSYATGAAGGSGLVIIKYVTPKTLFSGGGVVGGSLCTSNNIVVATLDCSSVSNIYLTDMYYSASFDLAQETESLFLDRHFDAIYLEPNNTLTAISGIFIPAILSQLISSTETESSFNAVFGNIGSISFTQKTSSVFSGDVAVFGGFNLALSTTTSFDSSQILANFFLTGETLSSFSAFVGITGSFVFDQNTIVLFNGGASNTSTDIGNILSYKIVPVMNLNTTGISEYTNYNFNSFFSVGNKYYGCCSDGVFLLEGDLDNAGSIAQSVIMTATTDFGTQKLKSVRDAYAYVRSSGDMFVSLVTNEQVDRSDYPLYYDGIDGVHRRRVKTAQGIRGTTWGASIKNDTNADFTLKQLDVIPKELDRSI